MRVKISALQEALTGHFDDHHAFVCRIMLANIDRLSHQIDNLTTRIELLIAPFQHQVDQLDEVPGVGLIGAQDILAETGVDMSSFPTDAHLVSWARFAPQIKESAGRRKGSSTTGQGNPWLGGALGEAATGAARSPTFLGARYKRIAKRRGTRRALVAVGHSILIIAWHLLSDPTPTSATSAPTGTPAGSTPRNRHAPSSASFNASATPSPSNQLPPSRPPNSPRVAGPCPLKHHFRASQPGLGVILGARVLA